MHISPKRISFDYSQECFLYSVLFLHFALKYDFHYFFVLLCNRNVSGSVIFEYERIYSNPKPFFSYKCLQTDVIKRRYVQASVNARVCN